MEAHKIFLRNGRFIVMASIAFVTLMAFFLLVLMNLLPTGHVVTFRLVEESLLLVRSPANAEFPSLLIAMRDADTRLFVDPDDAEWIFILAYSAASVLLSGATILASALSLTGPGNSLTRPELVVAPAAARCWKRSVITYFYVSLFGAGYVYLLQLAMLHRASSVTTAISICAVLLYAYLAVVWNLGMVVSVLEEKSGLEALGKASQLVKGGMELRGFCLSLVLTLLPFGEMQIWKFVQDNDDSHYVWLVLINVLWLVKMYGLVAFTEMYYTAKRNHGEETEMKLGSESDTNKNVSSLTLVTANLP